MLSTIAGFDGLGDYPDTSAQFAQLPGPKVFVGGPSGTGTFLSLAMRPDTGAVPNRNSITFSTTDQGLFDTIVAMATLTPMTSIHCTPISAVPVCLLTTDI